MDENDVYLLDDFVTEDSIYIIDTKDVKKENDCRADCETLDTHVFIDMVKLSNSSEVSRNSGQTQVNKEIKEEIEQHCLDYLHVESESKINVEESDNSKVGDESEDFYCNIKEEGRDGDFSEEGDQNSAHNEENYEEAMFETKIEVEYHGVQFSDMSGKEKLFKCDFCLKKFQRKESLLNHKNMFHLKIIKFKCNKCDFTTLNKGSLRNHLNNHDKKNYFKCHFCPHMTAKLQPLNAHILSKHKIENVGENKIKITSKIHKCTKCTYSSGNKTNYMNHIKVCLKLKNVEWYNCQICQFRTIQKSNLTAHIKTHTKIKDLKCSFCHYQCNRKACLDNHILSKHSDLLNENNKNIITSKIYSCKYCTYKSIWTHTLKRHLKLRH